MKHKVSELEGALLDAAVAKALGHRDLQLKNGEWRSRTEDGELSPIAAFSENWAAGGPISESAGIATWRNGDEWRAAHGQPDDRGWYSIEDGIIDCSWMDGMRGATQLVAALRAFVASKFGEEVDL